MLFQMFFDYLNLNFQLLFSQFNNYFIGYNDVSRLKLAQISVISCFSIISSNLILSSEFYEYSLRPTFLTFKDHFYHIIGIYIIGQIIRILCSVALFY